MSLQQPLMISLKHIPRQKVTGYTMSTLGKNRTENKKEDFKNLV